MSLSSVPAQQPTPASDDLKRCAKCSEDNCRMTLFKPGSAFAYYVSAASAYEGVEGPVLTGFCVSPLGPDCDEFGDQPLAEIARVRLGGLPPERDLHFEPMRLSEVEAYVARHGFGP